MRPIGTLLVFLALIAATAHAAEPEAGTSSPAAATSAPATAATPAKPAPPAPPATTSEPDRVYAGGLTNPEIENAFRKFSKRVVDDQVRYCRRETPLGTRLGKSVCYSAEQVLEMARAEREAGRELERRRDIKPIS